MTTIVTRIGKGSSLSWAEMDANLNNLNNDKLEAGFPASDVANTPSGNITSTDVQAAINELDTEKLAVGGPASSVANTPAGDIVATTVQAAINELDTKKVSLSSLASSSGSSLVGFIQSGTGTVLRTLEDKVKESVSVKDFGAVGDGVTDDTAAIQAARDYIYSNPLKIKLVFPAGIYKYSASPNWAIQGASIQAEGTVRLRYTGAGQALIIDAGQPGKVSNVCFGDAGGQFIVEAAGTTATGIYCRNIMRSKISARVYGAGTSAAAFRSEGCVLCEFGITVTNDEDGAWYLGSKPLLGISLGESATGHQTSYCTFLNCNVQSCQIGIYLDSTLGNIFIGGDSEYNSIYGLQLTANAFNNRFVGTDFEVNTTQDVVCAGKYNEFISCDTNTEIVMLSGASANTVNGGNHDKITIASGALDTLVTATKYARGLSANTLVDGGTRTRLINNFDCVAQLWKSGPNLPESHGSITVTASPFTYTNNTGTELSVFVQGGTISNMTYYRGGFAAGTLTTNQVIRVSVGDSLSITYSVAPTLKYCSV